jgi:tetratricopeptide (TPR) repeat protein
MMCWGRALKGMARSPESRSRFLLSLLLIVLFTISPYALHAGDLASGPPIVPEDIARSYFPRGEAYLIPVDDKTRGLVERARYHETRGNVKQALKIYAMAYRRAAGAPSAAYILFKQCSLEEDCERATGCLSSIIKDYPAFPLIDAVRYELAFRHYLAKEFSRALEILDAIEESERTGIPVLTPSALFLAGIIRTEQEEHATALSLYEQSLESMHLTGSGDGAGFYAALYLEIAKAQRALGDLDDAEKLLLRVYGTAPSLMTRCEALWQLGVLYVTRSDIVYAYSAFATLSDRYPDSPFGLQAKRKLETMEAAGLRDIEAVYDESILTGQYGVVAERQEEEEPMQGRGYALQMGSFSRQENARALELKLRQLGFPAFLVQARLDGEDYFRVRVGSFGSEEEARQALSLLQNEGFNGFVLREE